jgi:hypothetical protein
LKNELAASAVILVLVLGAAVGYFIGVANLHTNTTTTTIYTSATFTSVSNNGIYLMKVNGSFYWADDVSKDIVIGMPGYSYFLNGSVTFDGVTFTTICPPIYAGCPVPSGTSIQNQTTVMAGAIRFNMTFPDKSTETTGDVIGDSIYMFVLSQHYPKAGMLIEYVNDYPHNSVGYGVFLLVSSCCAPPYLS